MGVAAPTRSFHTRGPCTHHAAQSCGDDVYVWRCCEDRKCMRENETDSSPHCLSSSQGTGDGCLQLRVQRRVPGTSLHPSAAVAGTPLELWQALESCCLHSWANFLHNSDEDLHTARPLPPQTSCLYCLQKTTQAPHLLTPLTATQHGLLQGNETWGTRSLSHLPSVSTATPAAYMETK